MWRDVVAGKQIFRAWEAAPFLLEINALEGVWQIFGRWSGRRVLPPRPSVWETDALLLSYARAV